MIRRAPLATALLAGALVPTLAGASASAETVSIRPAADAYVEAAHPSSTYGREPVLLAEGAHPIRRAFLRFTVAVPAGQIVTRATLRLFARSRGGDAGVGLHFAAGAAWRERQLNWRTQPRIGGETVDRVSRYRSRRWLSLDATALASAGGNVAMALTTQAPTPRAFSSRNSRHPPRLVVETTPRSAPGLGLPPTSSRYSVRGVYDRDFSATEFDDEAALGFNFIDSSPNIDQMDALAPRGLKGFLWLGGYSNTTCSFNNSDDWVRSHVKQVAGHPGVGAYFVDDEPDPDACPNVPQQIQARANLVKSLDPGPPTLVVIERLERLKLFAGKVDVLGLDRYPCSIKNGCDYSKIEAQAAEADRLGVRYWGVIQAYGDDWYKVPTAEELHQQFEHWRATNMDGYLVFAWRYPDESPSTWLANNAALQAQLAIENAR